MMRAAWIAAAAALAVPLAAARPASQPRLTTAEAGVRSGAAKPAPAASLDAAVAEALTRRGGVGASVAVVENGRVVLAKGYGRPALGSTTSVGDDTLFAVGSVTKQFTSAAILLLAEEGRLSVDDKVSKYYPDLTRASDITLLDLMNHVSGYRDYYPLDFVDRRMAAPIAADTLLQEYAGAPLDFEPGTKWSYSNTGFILLGRIVEKVTAQPLGSFLDRRIFTPVGMRHTLFEPTASERRLARGYTSFALSPLEPATREASGWTGGAGGIYSTAGDLALWDVALMDGRVLKPASWALMTRPRVLADGTSSGYGCGLGIGTRGPVTVLSHGGAVSGFIASNMLVPETKSAAVVLLNEEDAGLMSQIGRRTAAAILPAAPKPQPATPGSAESNADAGPRSPRLSVAGLSPAMAASEMFRSLQRGRIDRAGLGDEYSYFLTDRKLAAAAKRLAPFGLPTKTEVKSVAERGGMEVASVGLTFRTGALDALMYRSPDGRIQEFLVTKP